MPFVKYDPYPGAKFGAGDFTDDQGRTMPLYHPEEAQRLLAQNEPSAPPETVTDVPTPVLPPEQQPYQVSTGDAVIEEPKPKLNTGEAATFDAVAKQIGGGVTADGLRNTFNSESGMNPKARNPKTGAAGIFQIMPDQEKSLLAGTGYDDITKMSKDEQIKLYPKYLAMHNAHPQSDADLALAQGAPAAIGQPPGTVIYSQGSKEALANPSWQDKTGAVTAGSLQAAFGHTSNPDDPVAQAARQLYAPMQGQPGVNQSTVTQKTAEGIPYTDEDKKNLHSQATQEADALKAAYQPVIDAQADLQKQQIARGEEIKRAQDAVQAKEDLARKNYDESTQRVQAATNDVLQDKQPPPFTQSNIFAGVLAAIAQGMGTYSAAINHTDNFAMRAVNQIIDQDNRRWQQGHLDKEFKVKSEKDLNANQWHDYQSQRSEREMQQRLLVDNELQQQMGLAKSADSQKALGLMQAENMQRYDQLDFNLQRAARGKAETTVTNMQAAATEGGAPDLETVNKRQAELIKSGKSPETVTAARREHGELVDVPVDNALLQKYVSGPREGASGRTQVDTSMRELEQLAPTLGITFDKGKFAEGKHAAGWEDPIARNPVTGRPLGDVGGAIRHPLDAAFGTADYDKRAAARTQTMGAMMNAVYAKSGKQINDTDVKVQADQYFSQSRPAMIESFNKLYRDLKQRRGDLDAEFPGAAAAFEKRRGEQQSTVDDNAPIPETPVAP